MLVIPNHISSILMVMKQIKNILLLGTLAITTSLSELNSLESPLSAPNHNDSILFTNGFDFPVGKPDGLGYYNAQGFMKNNHLGEDWNGIHGGDSDLGDPIYAIANGYVYSAKNLNGGWGNVIRLIHYLPNGQKVESVYAHCDTITIPTKQWVTKGQIIGTIGNANGRYKAHLHFEIRSILYAPIGPGYSSDTSGYLNPTAFINTHRK